SQPDLLGKRRRVEVPPGRIEDPEVVRVEVRLQIPAKRGEAEENGKGPPVFVPIDLTDHCLEWQIQFEVAIDFREAGGAAGYVVGLRKLLHTQLVSDACALPLSIFRYGSRSQPGSVRLRDHLAASGASGVPCKMGTGIGIAKAPPEALLPGHHAEGTGVVLCLLPRGST